MPTTFLLTPTSVFPPGTTVNVYIAQHRIDDQSPSGSSASSTTVASDGTIAFPDLTEDTAYVAYAFVGGAHRYIAFRTGVPSPTTGPAGPAGPTGPSVFVRDMSQPGLLAVSTGSARAYVPFDATLVNAVATVGVAPLGASIIVDVKRAGGTLYTTTANRPTILAGGNISTPAVPDIVAISGGSWLTVDIAQVGSSTASSTANTMSGSPNLASTSPTTGWANGMSVSGAGIPADTTIVSGAGTATMVMSQNATATATGVTVTGSGAGAGLTLTLYMKQLDVPPYSGVVLGESSLMSYWEQGDASLPTAVDSKGTNNGTYVGSPALNEASLVLAGGHAAKYNGSTQYMQAAAAMSPDLRTQSLTLEAWASIPAAPASSDRRILSVNDNVGYIGINDSRHPFGVFYDAVEQKLIATDISVPLNTPTHIVATFDHASLTHRFYVNGVQALFLVGPRPINYAGVASNVAIASETGGTAPFRFNGTVHKVAVYNGALSSARVLAHATKGLTG